MGKGGVEPFPLLRLPPQFLIRPQQFRPHCFKRGTYLTQFVPRYLRDGEVQIVGLDALHTHLEDGNGTLQIDPVEQDPGQTQPSHWQDCHGNHLDTIQQTQNTSLLH